MIFIYMAVFVFSLVELIIVIAIMAILVGVVAATVIPYMEKSRKAKDQQQLSNVTTSVVSAVSEAEKAVKGFNCGYDTVVAALPNLGELMNNENEAAILKKCKSKAYNATGIKIYISYDGSTDATYAGIGDTGNNTSKDTSKTASNVVSGTPITSTGSGQVVTYVDTEVADAYQTDKNLEAISE